MVTGTGGDGGGECYQSSVVASGVSATLLLTLDAAAAAAAAVAAGRVAADRSSHWEGSSGAGSAASGWEERWLIAVAAVGEVERASADGRTVAAGKLRRAAAGVARCRRPGATTTSKKTSASPVEWPGKGEAASAAAAAAGVEAGRPVHRWR